MKQRWEKSIGAKIASCDIDGVLNFYPRPWVEFLNEHLATDYEMKMSFKDLNSAKAVIPYQLYRDLKFKYRDCGIKEHLKIRPGAGEMIHQLKAWGFKIVMLTARPFDDHPTLQSQTIRWLQTNQIPFDRLIWGKDKYVKVMTEMPHLTFHVEDHRYYANLIAKWGYRVYLVDNEYNQGVIHENIIRIRDLMEVLDYEA